MAHRTDYNAKYFFKVLGNAFLHIFLGFSYLMPRQKDKWLVGNAKGFNSNTKYFFLHAKLQLKKENCYWIFRIHFLSTGLSVILKRKIVRCFTGTFAD